MDLEDFKRFEGKKMVGHDGTLCQIKSADSEHITIYYPSTGLPRTEFIYKRQLKATCTFTTTFKSGDEIIDSHTIDDSKYDEMVELYNNLSNGKELDDFGVEYDMDSIYPIEFIRDLEELDKMAEEFLNKQSWFGLDI
jgi:PDZ domain-containing secreted protein